MTVIEVSSYHIHHEITDHTERAVRKADTRIRLYSLVQQREIGTGCSRIGCWGRWRKQQETGDKLCN